MTHYNKAASEYGERFTEAATWLPCPEQYCPLLLRQLFSIFLGTQWAKWKLGRGGQTGYWFTAEWTGVLEAREGTQSQLSELGQRRPDRVLSHGWVNWGSGGQRKYWFTAEWIGARVAREGAGSQLSELGWWRPVTANWTGAVETNCLPKHFCKCKVIKYPIVKCGTVSRYTANS